MTEWHLHIKMNLKTLRDSALSKYPVAYILTQFILVINHRKITHTIICIFMQNVHIMYLRLSKKNLFTPTIHDSAVL